MTVYGRQGSPTLTIALPFSRVDVKSHDSLPAATELAALLSRLARALDGIDIGRKAMDEIAAVADAAERMSTGSAR
jgi:hypothetical protein